MEANLGLPQFAESGQGFIAVGDRGNAVPCRDSSRPIKSNPETLARSMAKVRLVSSAQFDGEQLIRRMPRIRKNAYRVKTISRSQKYCRSVAPGACATSFSS